MKGQTYLPGAYEPAMGLFHAFVGYCDDANLPSTTVNVRKYMCTCRSVEVTIGKFADPELDAAAFRLADQGSLVDPSQVQRDSFMRMPSGLSRDGYQEKASVGSIKPPLAKKSTGVFNDDMLDTKLFGAVQTPPKSTKSYQSMTGLMDTIH